MYSTLISHGIISEQNVQSLIEKLDDDPLLEDIARMLKRYQLQFSTDETLTSPSSERGFQVFRDDGRRSEKKMDRTSDDAELEAVTKLVIENTHLKQQFIQLQNLAKAEQSHDDAAASPKCIVCQDRDVYYAFHPCGHTNVCDKCSEKMSHCPTCRKLIENKMRVYL